MCSPRAMQYYCIVAYLTLICLHGSSSVEFEDAPSESESVLGSNVLIRCDTKAKVAECQWYWASLTEDESLPIIVSTFPAYGNGSHGCSVRFKNIRTEQEGLWICGAREDTDSNFTLGLPFKLTVVQATVPPLDDETTIVQTTELPSTSSSPPLRPIKFAEIAQDSGVKIGMPMHLICKTTEPVDECLWSWKANETEPDIHVKRVEPFGDQRLNCDIRFDQVLKEHKGIWTCGARLRGQQDYSTARPIQVTISKEVGFVQLSRDIQVAIDEPVLLRCITNTAVEQCQWTWQSLHTTNNATGDIIKEFSAYGDASRDCSVRFKNVLEQHAGVWTCKARLDSQSEYSSAPPANLTIIYPDQTSFLEDPQDTLVALGQPVVLRCVTSTPMDECSWTWRSLNDDNDEPPMLVKSFPPFDNYSRDCSVRFQSILVEQEGMWGCQVRGAPNNSTLSARQAKLTVYVPGSVSFVQLTKDILIFPGGPIHLQCITSSAMEQCQWTWQALSEQHTTAPRIMKQFKPYEKDGRDCSIFVPSTKTEQEGIWTCGVRPPGEADFTLGTPTIVTMLHQESVTVALWSSPENSVSLACRMSTPKESATCHWYHPPNVNISELNYTKRYTVHHKKNTGVCTLSFSPGTQDLGQWACGFNVDTQAGDWEMASANLILLTTSTSGFTVADDKMGWLIGVLALMVLILTGTLVAVSVCKCRDPVPDDGLGCAALPGGHGDKKDTSSRYTDTPTKINFQFRELPGRVVRDTDVVHSTPETLSPQQHIYERVDKYITPTTSKSIYENIE